MSNNRFCIHYFLVLCFATFCVLIPSNAWAQETTVSAKQLKPGIATKKPDTGPAVKVPDGWMIPYRQRIPGTDIEFPMVPVPGGVFLMGSPESEKGHEPDEAPQVKVRVAPMWVAQHEVSNREYEQYCDLYTVFKEIERDSPAFVNLDRSRPDIVSAPTSVYDPELLFEYSPTPKHPAVSMTRYSAKQYTKWLSVITELQYRLPTEAEWEYACRGGEKGAYSWGGDAQQAGEYCWYFGEASNANADFNYELSPPGQKLANAFGLKDMLGNVGEWTVDAYSPDTYKRLHEMQKKSGKPVSVDRAVLWPVKDKPGVVRGGSCESDLADLRCAARLHSKNKEWQSYAVMFPPSPWWYSGGPTQTIGFRVFRSYESLPKETIKKFWNHTSETVKEVVDYKMESGIGAVGIVDDELRRRIKQEKARKKAAAKSK